MATDKLSIVFRGGMADDQKLPAYAAAQSLTGLTRAILIPAIYLQTGKVRHRGLEGLGVNLNLVGVKGGGSVDSFFEIITDPAAMRIIGELGVELVRGLGIEFVKDFIYGTIKRCIGGETTEKIQDLESEDKLPPGDMEALVEAIGPAMREGHTTIGSGARTIVIISGEKNVVTLNEQSKLYLTSSVEDKDAKEKEFSIASFNANTGNGRCFDYDLGRTVAFSLDQSADAESITTIGQSLTRYAQRRRLGEAQPSRVRMTYRAIRARNRERTVKRIVIFARSQRPLTLWQSLACLATLSMKPSFRAGSY